MILFPHVLPPPFYLLEISGLSPLFEFPGPLTASLRRHCRHCLLLHLHLLLLLPPRPDSHFHPPETPLQLSPALSAPSCSFPQSASAATTSPPLSLLHALPTFPPLSPPLFRFPPHPHPQTLPPCTSSLFPPPSRWPLAHPSPAPQCALRLWPYPLRER